MKNTSLLSLFLFSFIFFSCNRKMRTSTGATNKDRVAVWLTNADKSSLFEQESDLAFAPAANDQNNVIQVDDSKTFQTMDGFGFCLTGGSAYLIHQMDADE